MRDKVVIVVSAVVLTVVVMACTYAILGGSFVKAV